MSAVYILIVVVILLLVVLIVMNYRAAQLQNDDLFVSLKYKIESLNAEIGRIESSVKNEIASNRN